MKVTVVLSAIPHYMAARLRALRAKDCDVFVVNAEAGGDFYAALRRRELEDIEVSDLPGRTPVTVINGTISLLTASKPNVVAVAGWATPACLAALAWARQNGKHVVVMSDSQAIDAARSPLREVIKSRVVCACDAALVAGRRHKDYVIALGLPGERVFLGYDAVDNAHFEAGAFRARADDAARRRRYGLPERYLLASARFIPKKNLPRLVEAYAAATEGLGEAPDLVVLGDGPERGSLEAAIASAGAAGRVHLLGFRDYDLLPDFYGLAEGFVHVSTSEQWGLVINEAAAAGLPLVVSESCGARAELLRDGENGFVTDPLDVADIARALRRLITLSPEAREAMGEQAGASFPHGGPKDSLTGSWQLVWQRWPVPLGGWRRGTQHCSVLSRAAK